MSTAVCSLIILGVCVLLFISELLPSATVAFAGCIAMVLFGVCDVKVAFSGLFNDITLLMFGMMIMGDALFSTGAMTKLCDSIVKLARGNEHRFIIYISVLCAALTTFLNNSSLLILVLTVCSGLASTTNMKMKNMAMPIAVAALFGGHCTLVGFATQMVASGMLNTASGESFSMFCLAKVAAPATILALLYIAGPGYKIGLMTWGKRADAEAAIQNTVEAGQEILVSKKKVITFCAVLLLVLVLFITGWTTPGIAALIGAVLVIALRLTTEKKAFKSMNWSCIIWMAGCLGLGSAVSAGGGAEMIGDLMFSVLRTVNSPMLILAIICFVAMLLSQLMNNAAALFVILPATLSMVIKMGLNPFPFAYAICLCAGLTFLTPLANGNIALTMVAGYKFTDYIKYGAIPTAITYTMTVLLTPLFYPLAG